MASKEFIEASLKPDATMLWAQAMKKDAPKPKRKYTKKKKAETEYEEGGE